MNRKTRRLNYLLVMPRLVQSIGDGYVFPLGLAYISASMKKAGFNVITLNLNHREGDVPEIIKGVIRENDVDVVATGGLSPQYHLVKAIVESAKRVSEHIVTIIGGGLISAEPETAMETLEFADFGVIGEGEVTMCELCQNLEDGGDPALVDGLVFKDGTDYRLTGRREEIENIDEIPWPDYDGFNIEEYLECPPAQFAGVNKNRMICMLGSRSCPHRCTFCFHTNGRKYRQRSLDDFFAELDYLVSRYDIEYISMADELFAPEIDRARDFCARIKQYNMPWYADFRVDTIDTEMLRILKDSGIDVMFFGLESADDRILRSMRKGITVEQIERALSLVYESGIAAYGCFIFGDIEETSETAENTLKWWREHPEYNIHLTLVKPFPGSHIYQHACQNGMIADRKQYLKDGCPQVNISKLSDDEFSKVVCYISQAQSLMKPIDSIRLLSVDPLLGRATISGVCASCAGENTWENIKLFANDYIYCSHCRQKYDIPCPPPLRENLDKNIDLLLAKYGKVAVWGMTVTIMDLFGRSEMLHDRNVFPVDISESKRKTDLYGKKIYAPDVLDKEGITVVVIAVPSHAGQISCQVRDNHPNVTRIIDICQLVDFKLPASS